MCRHRASQSELGEVELLAGRPAAAEALISAACEMLERMGNRGHYVTVAGGLGDALLAQDRLDEAATLIDRIEDWAIDDDMDPQVGWRRLKGRLLALRGEFEEAERVGREAVELAGRADYIDIQARTHFDLAEVLRLAGRSQESHGRARARPAALRAERECGRRRQGAGAAQTLLVRRLRQPAAAEREAQTLDRPAAECEQEQAGDEQEEDEPPFHARDTTTPVGRCHRPRG